jgi:iron(II)-dependent oxidoreductase
MMTTQTLCEYVTDAREKTFALVADLSDEEMLGPKLRIVNPPLWEIGHVAWFQEFWVLRHAAGLPPIRPDVDSLYDSMAIAHETRWDLPLLQRGQTYAYLRDVRDRVLDRLRSGQPSDQDVYFNLLATFHEDMHNEAFTYTRQTHGYPSPWSPTNSVSIGGGSLTGDADVQGGVITLGSTPEDGFIFDNEKWVHPVEIAPFKIARAAVTQAEYAAFVDEGEYERKEYWSEDGWAWRESTQATHPVYWRKGGDGWARRDFDKWTPLEPHKPVLHVNWYEADAYSRWAGRRLPTEAEWEMAASWDPSSARKIKYPWGYEPPTPERANLDWVAMGALEVGALPDGDSSCGCRQMIGNVWEWTSTDFHPYPGFSADPYKDYSDPWFYDHKVLRGGCWATRSRLIRNAYRNFYKPDRRDVWSGFRTCAI